ncbi:MAG: ECF transporter S component [Eubacterium sp.]|nr:ECF transporter S component [Eubacterium sp.]
MAEKNNLMAENLTHYQVAARKRLKVTTLVIVMIPMVILLFSSIFGGNSYIVASGLIMAAICAPFFMVFEKRKPKAREIVLIAMMSAVTVAVHTAFHIVLPVQIGTAMVIISGISLGPEAGFLIGAFSRLMCNFYLGHGPWTPWQMFCWGLLGFLAGLIFDRGQEDKLKSRNFAVVAGPLMTMIFALLIGYAVFLIAPGSDDTFFGWRTYAFGAAGLLLGVLIQRKRLPVDSITMTVVTFLMVVIIYGSVMNICTVLTSNHMPGGEEISVEGLKLLYIAGLPYDIYHGIAAAVCVFLFGDSIIRKLERIKIKYGIYK